MGKYHSLSLVSSVKRNIGYNNILLYHCCVCGVCAHLPHFIAVCALYFFPFAFSSILPVGLRKCMQFVRWTYSILCRLIRWMWNEKQTWANNTRFYDVRCAGVMCWLVCTFYHRFTRMACSKQIGKVWSIWIQLNMICTMQTLACALHHYFRINRVEVSLIQSICGQFKDRQNKSLKIGKQSCKVELYFRFRLTLIENHFSCIYAMVWLGFALLVSNFVDFERVLLRCMVQHQHPAAPTN